MSELYERDFYGWCLEQAALLREGDLAAADVEHIAEELESLAREEQRELERLLTTLLSLLLVGLAQPEARTRAWRLRLERAREKIASHLADNPSLEQILADVQPFAYECARYEASSEADEPPEIFPQHNPWSFERAMRDAS